MKLSDLLLPDEILGDSTIKDEHHRIEEKCNVFVRLFGVDPDYSPANKVTYDEHGHANTPFYVGEELTKKEIIKRLRDNGIVSQGLLGRIKAELLLLCAFPDKSYVGYKFVKREKLEGDTKYRLEWQDFLGYGPF